MGDIVLALMRSLRSLSSPGIWAAILAPAALGFLLWLVAAFWGLGLLVEWLMANPPMTIIAAWGLVWLANVMAYLGGWMAIFAATYLVASMVAAIVVMPMMLKRIAAREYPDVAAMGADSFAAATGNSITALIYFILGWLLTLPLWLIPGLGLLIPLLLLAWYSRRTFAYDALSLHATQGEWESLRRDQKSPFYMLGMLMALLAHVPLVGLLVPAFSALAYIHLGLESLRRLRGGAVVTIIEGEVV